MSWFNETETEKLCNEYGRATITLRDLLSKLDINIENCQYKIRELEELNDNQLMGRSAGIYGEAVRAFYSRGEFICSQLNSKYKELKELRSEIEVRLEQSESVWLDFYGKQQEEEAKKQEENEKDN